MSNKPNKIKNTKTAERRRAQAEQLHASIADQVDRRRNSEQWIRFLQFARSFHSGVSEHSVVRSDVAVLGELMP